jgi:ATP-dependent Lon protease
MSAAKRRSKADDVVVDVEPALPATVPLLILRSHVPFPGQVISARIGMRENLALLSRHTAADEVIGAAVLLDPDAPVEPGNLSSIAVAGRILHRITIQDDTSQVVLQGHARIRLEKVRAARPYFKAEISRADDPAPHGPAIDEQVEQVLALIERLVEADDRYPDELLNVVRLHAADGSRCADLVGDLIQFSYREKRELLETVEVRARLDLAIELLQREVVRAQVAGEIRAETDRSIRHRRREAILREQLEVVRRELGELDPATAEIEALKERLTTTLPPSVAETAGREVERLHDADVRSREGTAIRAYVDWVTSLPWKSVTEDRLDMPRARRMLNERYFGLGSAKDRVLELLAVRKLRGSFRSPLLAIIGPSGTGRTRMARTIADMLDRRFTRVSMWGIRDEAELRGKSRHEVGWRPGRILDGLREAGALNPLFLIEDIDRLEADADAMLALIEALDPDRRRHFRDDYLGVPFDLSGVLFAISASIEEEIPEALRAFTFMIELSGYTERIKLDIARHIIWPRLIDEYGLAGSGVRMTTAGIRQIVRLYTREAGVLQLEERFRAICRRLAVQVTSGRGRRLTVGAQNLQEYLGKPVYVPVPTARAPQIGAAMGLAWTDEGGDLLPIEALKMRGTGIITLTGLLGEVMEESVEAALSYVRSRADELGIAADPLQETDLHVHFPEGAIPKDGPSAGITVATAIASLLANRPVRMDVAMTGEISLRGQVLPVGAVREKALAALRAGIRHVILPRGNESEVAEIPAEIRSGLQIHLVSEVSEVFQIALRRPRRR